MADEYAGLEVSDVKKLRQLEEENRRLKQMGAEQALDIESADNRFTAPIAGIAFQRTLEVNPFPSQVPPFQCQVPMGTG